MATGPVVLGEMETKHMHSKKFRKQGIKTN